MMEHWKTEGAPIFPLQNC
uniref:Uncharacterized protein n=1 Tax=Rhizophora mucronata TaxID=61149 RepID=A0A2P2P318_RHIMU